jgi:hypothetical protein
MLQSKIGRNFFIVFLLVNVVLIGGFVYAVLKRPDLLSAFLPGRFGSALSLDLAGNVLFLALLLLVDAALFLLFGITGVSHGLFAGLRISPRKMRWLLHERVGLANDISGIVAEAVQEEEKDEIWYLGMTRSLLLIGLLSFAAALPALCIAYTHASPNGTTIFENAGKPVANGAVSQDTILRFTADQLAGGLLLDIPEVFHLRATPVETNGANLGLGVLVVLYRALIGFGLLLWFVAGRRMSSLRDFAMEVAMPAADIVAMEPALQDGHGHHEHGHDEPVHHVAPVPEPVPIPVHADHGHQDHAHHDHPAPVQEDRGHEDAAAHSHHAPEEAADTHHDHGHHAQTQESAAESTNADNRNSDEVDDAGEADDNTSDAAPAPDHSAHDSAGDHAHDTHAHSDHHTHAADSVPAREMENLT